MGLSEVLILVMAVAGFAVGYLAAVLRHGDAKVGTPSASHNSAMLKLPTLDECHKEVQSRVWAGGFVGTSSNITEIVYNFIVGNIQASA